MMAESTNYARTCDIIRFHGSGGTCEKLVRIGCLGLDMPRTGRRPSVPVV